MRIVILIEKIMTYQKNVFFREITLHKINCLKRNVTDEYFSKITYKKNSILWNQTSDRKAWILECA